jgi:hypothetical protein
MFWSSDVRLVLELSKRRVNFATESPVFRSVGNLENLGGTSQYRMGANTQGFWDRRMVEKMSRSNFTGSILCLVVEEIDNGDFGIAYDRRKSSKPFQAKLRIMVNLFENTVLVSALSVKSLKQGRIQFFHTLSLVRGVRRGKMPARQLFGCYIFLCIFRGCRAAKVDVAVGIVDKETAFTAIPRLRAKWLGGDIATASASGHCGHQRKSARTLGTHKKDNLPLSNAGI